MLNIKLMMNIKGAMYVDIPIYSYAFSATS